MRRGSREASAMVTTTLTLTAAQIGGSMSDNVLPQRAHLRLNSRLLPGTRPEDVLRYVSEAAAAVGIAADAIKVRESDPSNLVP